MSNNPEIGSDHFLDFYLAKHGFRKVSINSPDYSAERERLSNEVELLNSDRKETKKDFDIQLKICNEEIRFRDEVIKNVKRELNVNQGEVDKLKHQIDGGETQISEQEKQIDTQTKEILRLQKLVETERENSSKQRVQFDQNTADQQRKLNKRTRVLHRLQGEMNESHNKFVGFLGSIQESVKFPRHFNLNILTDSNLQEMSNHIQNMTSSWHQKQNELEKLKQFKRTVAKAISLTETLNDGNMKMENSNSTGEGPMEMVIEPKFNCTRVACKAKFKFLSELKKHMKRSQYPFSRWTTGCKFCGEKIHTYSALWQHRKFVCYSRSQDTNVNESPACSKSSPIQARLQQAGEHGQFECLPATSHTQSKMVIKKVSFGNVWENDRRELQQFRTGIEAVVRATASTSSKTSANPTGDASKKRSTLPSQRSSHTSSISGENSSLKSSSPPIKRAVQKRKHGMDKKFSSSPAHGFRCICGKMSKTKQSLVIHIRTFKEKLRFHCKPCSKVFLQKSALDQHLKTAKCIMANLQQNDFLANFSTGDNTSHVGQHTNMQETRKTNTELAMAFEKLLKTVFGL